MSDELFYSFIYSFTKGIFMECPNVSVTELGTRDTVVNKIGIGVVPALIKLYILVGKTGKRQVNK